jgi:BirA family biotin operon repressor/biotin-[acetyl-CoA-carboxylase] ligase
LAAGDRTDSRRLAELLADLPVGVEFHDRIDSTNTRARTLLKDGLTDPRAIFADGQSAGRGRSGSRWHSPYAESLALSYALPGTSLEPADLVRSACLALCRALRRCGCTGIGIKWPNDVMLSGRKAGGILIESAGDGWAIGIGANLNNDPGDLPGLVYPAASARGQLGRPVDRTAVAADVMAGLYANLADLPAAAGRQHHRWVELSILVGRRIRLLDAGRSHTGVVIGLAPDGSLELESDGERRRHRSGSVDEVFATR